MAYALVQKILQFDRLFAADGLQRMGLLILEFQVVSHDPVRLVAHESLGYG